MNDNLTVRDGPVIHAPGVYFGLDEDVYHADPALGYTDIRTLSRDPTRYWWGSAMNPNRPRKKATEYLTRGSALHKLLFEGEEAFDRLYVRGAVHDDEMTPAEKAVATKAANKKAKAIGKTALSSDDYDRVVISHAMITRNPHLSRAFTGGMAEVSVFWVQDGVRCKGRIDYLKPRGVGDLKGLANQQGMWFPAACALEISRRRYDLQPGHYLTGREHLARYALDKDMVHGDVDPGWLGKVARSTSYAWQWVFFQMEGAPITHSYIVSPANPLMEAARIDAAKAISRYKEFLDRFGTDMWVLMDEPPELYLTDLPAWHGRQ